jgi:hypothetical protein
MVLPEKVSILLAIPSHEVQKLLIKLLRYPVWNSILFMLSHRFSKPSPI